MNDELYVMWKEIFMAFLKLIPRDLLGETGSPRTFSVKAWI
jgi:hypothetical protein